MRHEPTCRMLTFAINNTAFRELVDEFPEDHCCHSALVADSIRDQVLSKVQTAYGLLLPDMVCKSKFD